MQVKRQGSLKRVVDFFILRAKRFLQLNIEKRLREVTIPESRTKKVQDHEL